MKRQRQQQQQARGRGGGQGEAAGGGLMGSLVAAAMDEEDDQPMQHFPPPPQVPWLPPPVPSYLGSGGGAGLPPLPLPPGFDPSAHPFLPFLPPSSSQQGGCKGGGGGGSGRKRGRPGSPAAASAGRGGALGDFLPPPPLSYFAPPHLSVYPDPAMAAMAGGLPPPFPLPPPPLYGGGFVLKGRQRKPKPAANAPYAAAPFPDAHAGAGAAAGSAAAPQLTPLARALCTRARPFALREWFYATLDRAFFNEDAFGEALDAAGLGHLRASCQRLTRAEWGAVRAALGGPGRARPRRLSPAFLRRERQRLEAYRRVVRELQQGRLAAPPPGFPYEVPAKLEVGQAVTARHKRARLLARGHILTVDYERGRYRVQFERAELGTAVCTDTDIAVQGPPPLLFAKPRRPEPALLASDSLPLHHRAAAALLLPAPLLAAAVPSAASPSPPSKGLAAFVRKMLDRKEALVACLKGLNEQAEAEAVAKAAAHSQSSLVGVGALNPGASPIKAHPAAAASVGSPDGKGLFSAAMAAVASSSSSAGAMEFSPVLKQQYAWVVQALQRTNAALLPALELLRQQQPEDTSAEDGESSSMGEETGGGEGGGARVSDLVAAARVEAQRVCGHHRASKVGDLAVLGAGDDEEAAAAEAVLAEAGSVQALVEAAAAVILTLRRCAEERKRPEEGKSPGGEDAGAPPVAGMTALGVEQSVGAAMEELKRRVLLLLAGSGGQGEEELGLYEEALGLLKEIEGSVAYLKREMLL